MEGFAFIRKKRSTASRRPRVCKDGDLQNNERGLSGSFLLKTSRKAIETSNGNAIGHVAGETDAVTENKLRRVKLKLGGVTRTFHTNSSFQTAGSDSSARSFNSSEYSGQRQKLVSQDDTDDNCFSVEKANDFAWDLQKDFSIANFSDGVNKASFEPVRKGKRTKIRRVFDGSSDDGEKDSEIHYLEKIKNSRFSKSREAAHDVEEGYGLPRTTKQNRNRFGEGSNDIDFREEEGSVSTAEPGQSGKKQKISSDSSNCVRAEPLITTRKRALQSSKDGVNSSLIEFPNGLPPAPSRRQKEKLSEEERQAKKAEAAQRRKMQLEKAAKETEALVIRKILGLDSDKKKAEKERARAEKAEAANSQILAPNTVRLVMGPNGTVVTFPDDVGLPTIFDARPCSYPPPREKCAGPSCTNAYKYRDSRSRLPLCSLQCYRAVQGSTHSVTC